MAQEEIIYCPECHSPADFEFECPGYPRGAEGEIYVCRPSCGNTEVFFCEAGCGWWWSDDWNRSDYVSGKEMGAEPENHYQIGVIWREGEDGE